MCARSVSSAPREYVNTHRPKSLFITPNTNIAAFLIVASKLHYCGAQLATTHEGIEFQFDDPENEGPQLLRVFKSRTAEAEPNALFEAQGFLRSEVKRIRAGVDRGETR
jgi:hypothetical protein